MFLEDENFSATVNCLCGFLGFVVMRFGLCCVRYGGEEGFLNTMAFVPLF